MIFSAQKVEKRRTKSKKTDAQKCTSWSQHSLILQYVHVFFRVWLNTAKDHKRPQRTAKEHCGLGCRKLAPIEINDDDDDDCSDSGLKAPNSNSLQWTHHWWCHTWSKIVSWEEEHHWIVIRFQHNIFGFLSIYMYLKDIKGDVQTVEWKYKPVSYTHLTLPTTPYV